MPKIEFYDKETGEVIVNPDLIIKDNKVYDYDYVYNEHCGCCEPVQEIDPRPWLDWRVI